VKAKVAVLVAGVAAAMSVNAQTWSTNFDDGTLTGSAMNAGDLTFEVPGSVTGGVFNDFSGDGVLALGGTSTATFQFTTATVVPYFLVSFWTSSNNIDPPHGGTVNVQIGSQTEGFAVPALSGAGSNPNPQGTQYSYHFGSGTPWAAGTYTLSFDNAPSSGFRLDDVSVSAVPEPSAITLMVAALGAAGFLATRRRKVESQSDVRCA
jgi:hypothetical protein